MEKRGVNIHAEKVNMLCFTHNVAALAEDKDQLIIALKQMNDTFNMKINKTKMDVMMIN